MPPKKSSAKGPKPLTKAQYITELAAETGHSKVEITGVLEAMAKIIEKELRAKGKVPALPGLVTLRKVDRPAKPARPGRNPATGEMMTFKAKPASKSVKSTIHTKLKEMV